MKITAAVTASQGPPFVLEELELGPLRSDEILVRVAASGICHTDLICRDQWLPVPLPAVLGHEGAGVVAPSARLSPRSSVGDRIGMTFDSCGRVRVAGGKPSYCHRFFEHNFARARAVGRLERAPRGEEPVHAHFFGQSSFAPARWPRAQRRHGREHIPLDIVAPFGCGIQTGAGAVLNSWRARRASIAVFGTGAVGIPRCLPP